ncbi:MAG: nucleoside monophosphate kinase [Patescibacteria group bacterium]|nr:nucleoside monophosphate kinase [Patescibacteria group bacterium]
MHILIVGIKASGKGTQARQIAEELNVPHISSGDLLREIDKTSPLGKEVRSYIDKGNYIPDKLILKIVSQRLAEDDCQKGVVFDGFPRTLVQAKAFDKSYKFDKVIFIDISKKNALHRIAGRWTCSNEHCNISYNILTTPKPQKPGICDECGSKLFQREDETKEAALKRINTDLKEMNPMLEFYEKQRIVIKINGEQSIQDVHAEIVQKLCLH